MCRIISIAFFRERLAALKKVKRGVYATVEDEIRHEFAGKPIEQIRINNDMILMEGELAVIKLRLPDRKHRLSKKDGFRLIYLVSKVEPIVAFLDIYPKNGPMQQLDESDEDIMRLVNAFISESKSGLLQLFSL